MLNINDTEDRKTIISDRVTFTYENLSVAELVELSNLVASIDSDFHHIYEMPELNANKQLFSKFDCDFSTDDKYFYITQFDDCVSMADSFDEFYDCVDTIGMAKVIASHEDFFKNTFIDFVFDEIED